MTKSAAVKRVNNMYIRYCRVPLVLFYASVRNKRIGSDNNNEKPPPDRSIDRSNRRTKPRVIDAGRFMLIFSVLRVFHAFDLNTGSPTSNVPVKIHVENRCPGRKPTPQCSKSVHALLRGHSRGGEHAAPSVVRSHANSRVSNGSA